MEPIGVRAAARELGVAPSTISRQIANGIIPNRGTDDEPKVDLEEARTIRANLVDPLKHTVEASLAVSLEDDDEEGESLEGEVAGENSEGARRAPPASITDPEFIAARVEKAKLATKLAQLEYDRRIGLLIPKADVETAIVDATRALRDSLLRVGDKVSVEVAATSDPVEVAKVIRNELRELLERFTAQLSAQR